MKPTERIDLARARRARRNEWFAAATGLLCLLILIAVFRFPKPIADFWYDDVPWWAKAALMIAFAVWIAMAPGYTNDSNRNR